MRIPYHQSESASDWEHIPSDKRNIWQRLAARSNGVLTLANFVSLFGAVLVVIGLFMIANGDFSGIFLVLAGRLADIADGYLAEFTGTKSPLGEAIDASLDKLVLLLALIVLWTSDLLTLPVFLILLAHGIFNSVVGLVARQRKIELHPTVSGKYATAALWATLLLLPAAQLLDDASTVVKRLITTLGLVCFGFFIWYGVKSGADYYRQLAKRRG